MPHPGSAVDGASQPPGALRDGTLSLPQLAHELNSLLDGAMRSVRLAERALENAVGGTEVAEAAHRLRLAGRAMTDMTAVLSRAIAGDPTHVGILRSDRSLQAEADLIMAHLAPLAESAGVQLSLSVASEAGRLPAGPLGAVLVNGLRNAIEACGRAAREDHRVDASISVNDAASELAMVVTDTGPGPSRSVGGSPSGHGLGLTVCRRVVEELGGRMRLADSPEGRGAELRVVVPLVREGT